MAERDSFADLFIGLISGFALGVVMGVLNAPQSGAETRALLRERAAELRGRVGEVAEDARMDSREWGLRLRRGRNPGLR